MDNSVNRKKKTIVNIIYYGILFGLFYFFMRYAFGIFLPFIIAFIVAAILQKPINTLTKRLPLKKGFVSAVLVILTVGIVVTIITLIGAQLVSYVKDFGSFISGKIESLPDFLNNVQDWIYRHIKFLPDSIESVVHTTMDSVFGKLNSSETIESANAIKTTTASSFDFSSLSAPISGLLSTAKQIPSILIAVVITIFACCFMAADYDVLMNFIKRQFPKDKRHTLVATRNIIKNSVFKLCKAYILIIFITFCEMMLGLKILELLNIYRSGYIFFIAACVAVVDIMPVLGTGTILIPWTIYSFIVSETSLGIGLAILYIFITVARQFIEPKLVAGQLGLPPFVTIMAMYVGLKLFGFIGIFVTPFAIIILKLLNDEGIIHLWVPQGTDETVTVEEDYDDKKPLFSFFRKKNKK